MSIVFDDKALYGVHIVSLATSCVVRSLFTVCVMVFEYPSTRFKNDFGTVRIGVTDFYIDDLQTSAGTFEDVCQVRDELIKLLKKGGSQLRQWCVNDKHILDTLS